MPSRTFHNHPGVSASSTGTDLSDLSFSMTSSEPGQSSSVDQQTPNDRNPWSQRPPYHESRTEQRPVLRTPPPRATNESPTQQRLFSPFPAFSFDASVAELEPSTQPHLHPYYQAVAAASEATSTFPLLHAETTNPQALPLPPSRDDYIFPDSTGHAALSSSHPTATAFLAPPGPADLGPTRLLPSPPSVQEALESAHERIRELEAELAALKQADSQDERPGTAVQPTSSKRRLEQSSASSLTQTSAPVLLLPPSLAHLPRCPVCSHEIKHPQPIKPLGNLPGWAEGHWNCLPQLGPEGIVPVLVALT
ncbi:hypothetical protein JCM5296_005633 [Sporobolomyces johnsonii]